MRPGAKRSAAPGLGSAAGVVEDALGELGGAVLVLDADLKIVASTRQAKSLLGFEVPLGQPAPRVLCGGATQRPVAEALAAGQPVTASIPHPGSAERARRISVRSVPIGPLESRTGWLLLLDDASDADAEGPVLFHGMWTQSAAMKAVFRVIERVAADDMTVLVRGETGAGKELVAHAIHALSARRDGPLRILNCAALPANLLESELFGHTRGAFTGAVRDVPGHVQLAHKGTLFLDEVAELPLELQAKLLRVIETRTVIPVGGRDHVPVDVRIVSATHRALRKEVEAGRFRADLMYRLRVIPIFLPPLRERRGDIRLLAETIVAEMNPRSRRKILAVSPAAVEVLERYDFPGNVRELKNVLAYAFAIGDGPILLPSDLPPEVLPGLGDSAREGDAPSSAAAAGSEARELAEAPPEVQRIRRALERSGGNRERAAKILGLSRVTLWRRMRELGIEA
jgi:transcriptional regulator with PAS, ATPase and Fis domain